jgi:hypothetical protein
MSFLDRSNWTVSLLEMGWDVLDHPYDSLCNNRSEWDSMRRVYNRLCATHPREAALVLAIEDDNLESIVRNLSYSRG